MKSTAVVFDRPKKLSLQALELPNIEAGQVEVAVQYSGMSTGAERMLWDGSMSALSGMDYPLIPGFETFGQVWYTDENGRPWIKEFRGNAWAKELLMKDDRSIGFSVFINNQFLEAGRYVTLTKKIDNLLVDQKVFMIDKEKIFDGWFKMGS